MRVVIFLIEEVDVVRGDYADAEFAPELQGALHDAELALVEVPEVVHGALRDFGAGLARLVEHHLEGIIVAEEVLVAASDFLGLVHAT